MEFYKQPKGKKQQKRRHIKQRMKHSKYDAHRNYNVKMTDFPKPNSHIDKNE